MDDLGEALEELDGRSRVQLIVDRSGTPKRVLKHAQVLPLEVVDEPHCSLVFVSRLLIVPDLAEERAEQLAAIAERA